MPYVTSPPLARWLGDRRARIDVLAQAHAYMGDVDGRGRPLDISRPIAHAYVTGVVAEFQGFTRDLHDLGAERLVTLAGVDAAYVATFAEGLTASRGLDRGNATLSTLASDFKRLGISALGKEIAARDARWATGDKKLFEALTSLRNALAHGNPSDLRELHSNGVRDSVTWARNQLPVLNRVARAMDHATWDHLKATTGTDPWRRTS